MVYPLVGAKATLVFADAPSAAMCRLGDYFVRAELADPTVDAQEGDPTTQDETPISVAWKVEVLLSEAVSKGLDVSRRAAGDAGVAPETDLILEDTLEIAAMQLLRVFRVLPA